MNHFDTVFGSIELVCAVWGICVVALTYFTIMAANRVSWQQLRKIAREEDGAAYTLSYVMVVPFYIFFICLVVETTLMIVAKYGTTYAAYAGVRSAIVHYSNRDLSTSQEFAEHAAIRAFAPFANGIEKTETEPRNRENQSQYLKAHRLFAAKPASERYLRSKYDHAHKHLKAQLKLDDGSNDAQNEPWLANLTVDVEYRYAFHVPGVGLLLGKSDAEGRFYAVHSSATLQSEAPMNEEESLGIDYERWR